MKEQGGKWNYEQKIWSFPRKSYEKCLEEFLRYCNEKEYLCLKIPSFVFAASQNMPLELPIRNGRYSTSLTL